MQKLDFKNDSAFRAHPTINRLVLNWVENKFKNAHFAKYVLVVQPMGDELSSLENATLITDELYEAKENYDTTNMQNADFILIPYNVLNYAIVAMNKFKSRGFNVGICDKKFFIDFENGLEPRR